MQALVKFMVEVHYTHNLPTTMVLDSIMTIALRLLVPYPIPMHGLALVMQTKPI